MIGSVKSCHGVGQFTPRCFSLDLSTVATSESGLARQQFAENRTKREDVGPFIDLINLTSGLFRGHVRWRSQDRTGLGEVEIGFAAGRGDHGCVVFRLTCRSIVNRSPSRQHFCQAPIHHLHFAERTDHHVRWFQVAMDDSSGVRVGHRLADRFKDGQKAR